MRQLPAISCVSRAFCVAMQRAFSGAPPFLASDRFSVFSAFFIVSSLERSFTSAAWWKEYMMCAVRQYLFLNICALRLLTACSRQELSIMKREYISRREGGMLNLFLFHTLYNAS
ncbi:hypothetical protein P5V15_010171 [Pogonomyrmex californicus]